MEALVLKRSETISNGRRKPTSTEELTVASHARLARNTGWDEDDFSASQAFPKGGWRWVVALDLQNSQLADIVNRI